LSVYINDLLDATRLETGKLDIELKPASLKAIIQRAITMIQPEAAAKKIYLNAELDGNLPNAAVDQSRILQILTNLLNNAVKFTPEGGSIVVKLGPDPKRPEAVQISITDTGCGIPKDQVERIFDRLYQVKAGDLAPKGGIGLGLYLCRELVLLHGGNIWVESELGKGSTFSFVIPQRSLTKGAHVLIVDDEYEIPETLCLALEDKIFRSRRLREELKLCKE
jgi:signal transduction histidine kinase